MNTVQKFKGDRFRLAIEDCLSKNLFANAICLTEALLSYDGADPKNAYLTAQSLFGNGEPRRSLAILERKGLLSADTIAYLADSVNPTLSVLLDENCERLFDHQQLMDSLRTVQLAVQCMYAIGQYDNCLSLLLPLLFLEDNDTVGDLVRRRVSIALCKESVEHRDLLCPVATLYLLAGHCFFQMDNQVKACRALKMALYLDPACLEAAEFLVNRAMLSEMERTQLSVALLERCCESRKWIVHQTRKILCGDSPHALKGINESQDDDDASGLVRQAEHFLRSRSDRHEAYRCARRAYSLDPFADRCLIVYLAALVELRHTAELFYVAHELAQSCAKSALVWYAISCYYWCSCRPEIAQPYLQKSIKADRRCVESWVLLGHVLSALEENEQAISAFRTAVRLSPADYRPVLCMAKELLRTSHPSLAVQVLLTTPCGSTDRAELLNEIGVGYLHLPGGQLSGSEYLERAIGTCRGKGYDAGSSFGSSGCEFEVLSDDCVLLILLRSPRIPLLQLLSNYAIALRKCRRLEEALACFERCLAMSPTDADCLADVAFTLHLLQRFEDAIEYYHRALTLRPTFAVCTELLDRAVVDSSAYLAFAV